MQKSRHLKTAMQLWVADNRKRMEETPGDLAALTGVTTDTARAWESRGSPSEDAIRVLERHFGRPAPQAEAAGDTLAASAYLARIDALVATVDKLVEEIRASRATPPPLPEWVIEALGQYQRTAPPPQTPDRATTDTGPDTLGTPASSPERAAEPAS